MSAPQLPPVGAGGEITDAMVEAALNARVPGGSEVWAWLPQEDAFTPHQTARDVMRCALEAALSASPVEGGKGFMASRDHAPATGSALERQLRTIQSLAANGVCYLAQVPADMALAKAAFRKIAAAANSSAEQVEGERSRDDPKSPLTNGVREETKAGERKIGKLLHASGDLEKAARAFFEQSFTHEIGLDRNATKLIAITVSGDGRIRYHCEDEEDVWTCSYPIATVLALSSPPLGAAVEALKAADAALREHACHVDNAPCLREKTDNGQCVAARYGAGECGLEAGNALLKVSAALANLEPR